VGRVAARFRFTHVWLFLAFTPTAPIWLGAWGLIISLGSSFFVWLNKGPRLLWSAGLIVGSALALVYPGLGARHEHQPAAVDPGSSSSCSRSPA
jgi:hypothetical protein